MFTLIRTGPQRWSILWIKTIKDNAVAFLQKPFDMVQLSNKVHSALNG